MEKYLATNKGKFSLSSYNSAEHLTYKGSKDAAIIELAGINAKLTEYKKIHIAEKKHKILIVLQGIDASGKDGATKNIFSAFDTIGVYVAHFSAPTPEELSRDYLWRIHNKVPAKGEIVVFNRSHYEDILIVKVQELAPKLVWQKRYRHIRDFERMLHDEGTTIIKMFLNISNGEQKNRLQARLDNPIKHWKIDNADIRDRNKWDDYIEAYEDAITQTNAKWAPWYIVPSDAKWYRDLVISKILLHEFKKLKLRYPKPKAQFQGLVIK